MKPSTHASERKSSRWFALAVALVTFAVFIPSIAHPFVVWDDGANFVDNPHYRGLGLEQLKWMFTTFHLGPYQPLSWMTLGLDWLVWGMDATGYHLTNVVIHSVAAALVTLLAMRLFESRTVPTSANKAHYFGVAVGLVWALHPLRVEAVSWVTERREVLSGAFLFATLLVSLRGGRWWSFGLLALCAMLAKGTTVVLAPLLILMDVFVSRELKPRALFQVALRSVRRHALVIAFAAVFSVLAIVGQRSAEAIVSSEAHGAFERVRIFANSIRFYVTKTVWPSGLAPMYDPPADRSTLNVPALLGVIGLVAFFVFTWRSRSRIGHVWTLAVAYVAVLLPVGGLVQVGSQLVADRYSYQPGAVVTLALVAVTGIVLASRLSNVLRWSVLTLVCAACTWRTVELQTIWSGSKALWVHQLSEYPDSPIAHLHLGLLQVEGKDPTATPGDAERHFRAAVARSPGFADAWVALGDVMKRTGRIEDALVAYDTAARAETKHRAAHQARASALWIVGRRDEALTDLRRLCDLAPNDFQSHLLLARALAATGDMSKSKPEYEKALALGPTNLRPVTEFAWLLATHPDSAARDGERALDLAAFAAETFGANEQFVIQAQVAALAELSRFDEAVAILSEVRRSLPAAETGELDRLIAQFQAHEPLRIPPSYP
ncbi:MAG: tetratricopeptide repeat protein [Planctomycetota bacterium]|nr:tetratricopeptide repeat protein [Planctomycetota bacterium]